MKKLTVMFTLFALALLAVNGKAASFDISIQDDSVSSCPCTANQIRVNVENLYKEADTINFRLELPAGWSASQGFVQPDLMLGSGESETIPVYITPPCGCEGGKYTATLKAESARTGNEVSKVIQIETLKCYFLNMYAEESFKDICMESDEGGIFTIVMENQGKFTETFHLTDDKEWADFSDSFVTIAPGEKKSVHLLVAPGEGVEGIQAININAASDSVKASEQVKLNVRNCFGFDVRLTPSEKGDEIQHQNISTGEPVIQADNFSANESDEVTGMTTSGARSSWDAAVVGIIIIIVILVIIYIVVKK